MKQSKNIIRFFGPVIQDSRMYPSHISLYVSLFQLWSISRFQNPFRICRQDVMKLSKIKSFATYHKCINEIHNAGFINYSPSYNSYEGSSIEIIDFKSVDTRKNIILEKEILREEIIKFSVPMLYEIEMYFNERDIVSEEAYQFYSSYQSKNWKLTNNKSMKCWKAAARNWISKMKNTNQNQNL